MKKTKQERLKVWGHHCNDAESTSITLRSILKSCELALSNPSMTMLEESDILAIHYTLSMCSELAENLEELVTNIPKAEDYSLKAA